MPSVFHKKPVPDNISDDFALTAADAMASSIARALHNPLKPRKNQATSEPFQQALAALENVFFVIDEIRDILLDSSTFILKAAQSDSEIDRALLADRYDERRLSLEEYLKKPEIRENILIGKNAEGLRINCGQAFYAIAPVNFDTSVNGLNLPPPLQGFSHQSEVTKTLAHVKLALEKISYISNAYLEDTEYLTSRLEKTSSL